MKNKKKQYVIKMAYTDNYHVLQYVDGKLETHNIISYYELDGYIAALKNMGYVQAYYEREYHVKMLRAKEDYEFALADYEKAKENSLIMDDKEIERYRHITHSNDE